MIFLKRPMHPVFPEVAPLSTEVIYVRTTGDDDTGRGTEELPYRTFQKAVRCVPNFIPAGVRYEIDITDLGTETLPDDFALPSWKSSQVLSGYDYDDDRFYILSAVRIRANPKLASGLTAPEATIEDGTYDQNEVTLLCSVTDDSQDWTPGALKGLFLVGSGGVFEKSVIYDNTADTIYYTDIGEYTFPLSIMEPSARLEGQTASPGDFGRSGLSVGNQDSLVFAGIGIQPIDESGSPSMLCLDGRVCFELCQLVDAEILGGDSYNEFVSSDFSGGSLPATGITGLFSRLSGGTSTRGGDTDSGGNLNFFGTVFDGCEPVGKSAPGKLSLVAAKVLNATSNGIEHTGTGIIGLIDISDSAGNAILLKGPSRVEGYRITGTDNAGYGVHAVDGAQMTVNGLVDVTGASGDLKVGGLVARTWTDFRTAGIVQNEYDMDAPPVGRTVGDITVATNAAPVVITSVAHGLATGDQVQITGVFGSVNQFWTVVVTGNDTFELLGSDGTEDEAYVAGGEVASGGTSGARVYQ